MTASKSRGAPAAARTLRVTYRRTGGVAGVRLGVTLDAAALSPRRAATLRALVTQASFFRLPCEGAAAAGLPDRFRHCIEVEDGPRRHRVTFDEAAAPAALRPLLDWLLAAACRRG